MDALPASVNTVIAAPGDLAPEDDLTYTPSGLSLVGERAVLIPDAGLSATMSGVPGRGPGGHGAEWRICHRDG